ncbi:MAG: hypothetical protein F6J86_31465 [Symploca sp. SIO1B1]|nr:hypothetical protein [Symploca sp. SIO1C2]NER98295.1 hypothetical protein [Symploca sp. SIO1B1]
MLGIRFNRRLIFSFFIIPLTLWSNLVEPTIAQPTASVCQPPRKDEYLLFILTQARATYEDIRATLPPQLPTNFCQYLDDTVVRVGGFNQLLDAQGWARYFNEIVGLSAFVIQATPSRNAPRLPEYKPEPLADGYAVLVDYFSQPEIASELRQVLGTDVGLVTYAQRPYLLALHTQNEREANSKLQQLSDRGFIGIVVDSRSVILIRPVVLF